MFVRDSSQCARCNASWRHEFLQNFEKVTYTLTLTGTPEEHTGHGFAAPSREEVLELLGVAADAKDVAADLQTVNSNSTRCANGWALLDLYLAMLEVSTDLPPHSEHRVRSRTPSLCGLFGS